MRLLKCFLSAAIIALLSSNSFAQSEKVYGFGLYGDNLHNGALSINTAAHITDNSAFAADVYLSSDKYQTDVSLGAAINDKNQLKLTYELLGEERDFEFYTTTATKYVMQNTVGVAYKYLFLDPFTTSVEGYAGYGRSNSVGLRDVVLVNDAEGVIAERRNIAGADVAYSGVRFGISPIYNSRLSYGVSYKGISFRNKIEKHQKYNAWVQNIGVEKVFFNKVKAGYSIDIDKNDMTHGVTLGYLFNVSDGLDIEVAGNGYLDNNKYNDTKSYMYGLRMNFMLDYGAPNTAYSIEHESTSILTWTKTPVIRNTTVYAIAEAEKRGGSIDEGSATIADFFTKKYDRAPYTDALELDDNNLYNKDGWYTSLLNKNFTVAADTKMIVRYKPHKRQAVATYQTGRETYEVSKNRVMGVSGSDWNSSGEDRSVFECTPHNAQECTVILEIS